jgi:hypothetical protein
VVASDALPGRIRRRNSANGSIVTSQAWMSHLRSGMILVATLVLSGTAVAQPKNVAPSSVSPDTEADLAETWALYGILVPIGAATAISIFTNPSENDVPAPVIGAIGGLWALGGLWGVSVGYYRAGRPLAGTLLGLGKTALLGSCVLADLALEDRAPTDSMGRKQGSGLPFLTILGIGGVVVWDVLDYLRLGRSIRERPPGLTVVPAIIATDRLTFLGFSGQF